MISVNFDFTCNKFLSFFSLFSKESILGFTSVTVKISNFIWRYKNSKSSFWKKQDFSIDHSLFEIFKKMRKPRFFDALCWSL